MSRASELFYNRRYRLNRAAVAADDASVSGTGLGFENSVDRNLHDAHHHHRQSQSHHRHDLDVCNPLRRSLHLRHQRVSRLELATVPHDQSNQQSASSNSMSVVEPQRNIRRPPPPVLSSSDRLPGSVLLARERLLERLRGVSLSGSRQSPGVLLRTTGNDHLFDDHWRLADASDWGAEISNRSFSSTSLRIDNLDLPPDRSDPTNGKKPPGLSQNAVDALPLEIFCCIENNVKEISKDCSICLESFMEGDKLLCLPCNHRFHSICLDPWIQICGDCPYCRKAITEAC